MQDDTLRVLQKQIKTNQNPEKQRFWLVFICLVFGDANQ